MESILWINVYEVISCRLLFWKEVHWFHLRFWIAMNWPDCPLPTCFIQLKNKGWTFATKPWLFIIIVNIITCQSKKHTDGIWWNIRSKSTNVLATAARSQSSRNAFTLKTWECELNLIRTNLQGQCVFLIHKKLPRPKKLPWPNWDKNGSWTSDVFLSPCSLLKTPQNHSQINILPFLMWQLFTAFHTKLHEGQKRQKMGEKGFSWGNLHCVAVGVRRGGW